MTVRKISSARGDMSRKIMLRMLQERLYKINENEIIHKDHTPLHTLPLSSSPPPPPPPTPSPTWLLCMKSRQNGSCPHSGPIFYVR